VLALVLMGSLALKLLDKTAFFAIQDVVKPCLRPEAECCRRENSRFRAGLGLSQLFVIGLYTVGQIQERYGQKTAQ
jgi:hypothetical protein